MQYQSVQVSPDGGIMQTMTAREILRAEYGNSRNFMTPDVIRVGKLGRRTAYELASGYGLCGDTLYGVSVAVVQDDGTTARDHDASRVFHSLSDAETYLGHLREHVAAVSVERAA